MTAEISRSVLRASWLVGILLTVSITSCQTVPPPGPTPAPTGYTIANDQVRFVFRPWEFRYITNGTTGKWYPLDQLPGIGRVCVAGAFNNWNPTLLEMTPDKNAYAATVPIADLEKYGPRIEFKFVIDGIWWVEPLVTQENRVGTNLTNRSTNLVLNLSEQPEGEAK
jgi:hypothetical protein